MSFLDVGVPRLESRAWTLPHVLVVCPDCGVEFEAPDLRRESVKDQRAVCPNTDCPHYLSTNKPRIINQDYKIILRALDELEKVELPDSPPVLTKVQLFLLEAIAHMGANGFINSHRLEAARIYGARAHVKTCLYLGLFDREGLNLYSLTPAGRTVVKAALARYAPKTEEKQQPAAKVIQ